ncbi:MAG: alpha/beta hydrolase fold domain-containing protein [Pseudonocardiaceae bacterium]
MSAAAAACRYLATGLALALTGCLLVAAVGILVPVEQWSIVGLVVMSILPALLVAALIAVVLAALVSRFRRRLGRSLAVLTVAATVVITVPLIAQWRTAQAYDAPLSLRQGLAPGLNRGRSEPARSITYATVGGQDLELDVWRPADAGARPRPAIVWLHGGSWSGGARGAVPKWNEWFTRRGYAVFDVEYRLEPQPNWRQAPADAACAVGWVKARARDYGVDPDRVMVGGLSAGAHLALQVGYSAGAGPAPSCTVGDTSVSAVIALYGPTDLVRAWESSAPKWQRVLERYLGGTPEEVPGRYHTSSPLTYVRSGLPPTFLVHGERDTVVPHEQMTILADALEHADVPHTALSLPYGRHVFDVAWGAFTTQITRHVLGEFLAANLR